MNPVNTLISVLITLCFFVSCHSPKSSENNVVETYRNPVIPGDFPDPTVVRVGDTYYAATSSSEWALPYRLFRSADLVNWDYIGPAIPASKPKETDTPISNMYPYAGNKKQFSAPTEKN